MLRWIVGVGFILIGVGIILTRQVDVGIGEDGPVATTLHGLPAIMIGFVSIVIGTIILLWPVL